MLFFAGVDDVVGAVLAGIFAPGLNSSRRAMYEGGRQSSGFLGGSFVFNFGGRRYQASLPYTNLV